MHIKLDKLQKIRDRVKAAGVKEKYLRYERLDSNHSLLDDVRTWLLGDLSRDPRCKTPRDGRTTLKIHTGAVSEHILNWGAVRDTLYGTKYEKYLDDGNGNMNNVTVKQLSSPRFMKRLSPI